MHKTTRLEFEVSFLLWSFFMSSGPPFFHRIIQNAWKSIDFPKYQYEGNLPLSSPTSITRIRSLTLSVPQNHGSDCLPLYHVSATEVEKLDYNPPKTPLNLSPKIVYLTFAALGYQTIFTSQDHPFVLGPAMVIAFAASLSVVLVSNNDTIKRSYPRLATIVEIIGYLSFTLSFLVMTKVLFSGNLILWIIIGGLTMVWTMVALLTRFST
ncbi:unnamed protein product [Sphenostylis stenocarpa]|uniref:Uncharacterized protein n=1 Tax=Sphenostylis stenocarpa TaxID=92480 RepID=A0AA86S386_9FABA|nr:unnamed protein product [Sphenostylis stenocarpa]